MKRAKNAECVRVAEENLVLDKITPARRPKEPSGTCTFANGFSRPTVETMLTSCVRTAERAIRTSAPCLRVTSASLLHLPRSTALLPTSIRKKVPQHQAKIRQTVQQSPPSSKSGSSPRRRRHSPSISCSDSKFTSSLFYSAVFLVHLCKRSTRFLRTFNTPCLLIDHFPPVARVTPCLSLLLKRRHTHCTHTHGLKRTFTEL